MANAISDSLTVLDRNGNIVAQVVAFEGQEGNGTAIFALPAGYAAFSQFGHATVLCETLPCNALSPISNFSDIVGIEIRAWGPFSSASARTLGVEPRSGARELSSS